MTTKTLLETKNVSRHFAVRSGLFKPKWKLYALQNISITIDRGDVVGLVGESGCGKSTLAKILLGLLPPTSGTILFEGISLEVIERRSITSKIQPVFQDPYSSLNPRKRIGSIIGLPLLAHGGVSSGERQERTEEMMELVGLTRRMMFSYPNQLSGGQRQRVAIARALIMKPGVVICDEPTSALDVSVQAQILNLLMKLQKEFNLTYLFISHNLAVVEHIATRVAVMYLGRIVEEAPTDALFQSPFHPYTQALLESVLTPDPGKGIPEVHLEAGFPNPRDPPSGCAFHPRCPMAVSDCKLSIPKLQEFGSERRVACHLKTASNLEN